MTRGVLTSKETVSIDNISLVADDSTKTIPKRRLRKRASSFIVEKIETQFPGLRDDVGCLSLFLHIATWASDEPCILPVQWLATFEGIDWSKHYVGQHLLERFKTWFPDFQWSEHRFTENLAREVLVSGIPDELHKMIALDRPRDRSGMIEWHDAKPIAERTEQRIIETESGDVFELLKAMELNPTQQLVRELVCRNHSKHLREQLDKTTSNVSEAISNLPIESQTIQERIVRAVTLDPQPYYMTYSDVTTGVRFHSCDPSIVSLKREVRKAACTGWIDVDLSNAQFAIASRILGAEKCIRFLAEGGSIWKELGLTSENKHIVKEEIYAAINGRTQKVSKRNLASHGLSEILSHPLLKELLRARNKFRNNVLTEKWEVYGIYNCFPRVSVDASYGWKRHNLRSDYFYEDATSYHSNCRRLENSAFATMMQEVELYLLHPCLELMADVRYCKQQRIYFSGIWQHDGFTLRTNRSLKQCEAFLNEMQARCRAQGSKLGIVSKLTFEQLQ
jgi:hypothetical protein